MIIRRGRDEDMDEVAKMLRLSFDPEISAYMTYTQSGAAAFLRTYVNHSALAANRVFLVAEGHSGQLDGFAEFRIDHQSIGLLSYICVSPTARRRGLARALIERFVNQNDKIDELRLDVFEGNAPALSLYQALGFRAVGRTIWFTRPLPRDAAACAPEIVNLPAATAVFNAYGFCELAVAQANVSTRVGRIGEGVLRLFNPADFDNETLLASLAVGFPRAREALFISTDEAMPGGYGARTVNSAIRMTWDIRDQRGPQRRGT